MAKNKGSDTEKTIAMICSAYRKAGRANIRKVDPPTLTMGKGRTILLENPFLDFMGVWTEAGRRSITFEVKRTAEPRLPVNRPGQSGITVKQWQCLQDWDRAGACTFILWHHPTTANPHGIRILTIELIRQALQETERASVPWNRAIKVERGNGFITHDFLNTAKHLTI